MAETDSPERSHVVPEAADGPAALKVQEAFVATIAERYPGWDPSQVPAEPARLSPSQGGAWLVAYRGAEAVGGVGFTRIDRETAEVRRLFVDPAVRQAGVARLLIAELERVAMAVGYTRLRLDTGANQPEALAFFRGTGFHEIGDYNANRWASHWFEKQLTPDR